MATAEHRIRPRATIALAAIATGAAVSVALGVYGSRHDPTGQAISTFGFPNLIAMKVWLGFIAGAFALVQLGSALWMFGHFGRPAPRSANVVHRMSGTLAVVLSLPVAYHCLWSLGFQSYDNRVLIHSLAGCAFYGVFVTKVFALHSKSSPGWLVPLAGGLLLTVIVLIIFTSSVWYVREIGWPATPSGY